ncbi:MAG: hypothetical protein WDO71_21580 [Bacteroidota bacterium]
MKGIIYAESCSIKAINLSLVYEFIFTKISDTTCGFACRFMNMNESPVPGNIHGSLFAKMQEMAERLKEYCEKMETSLFEGGISKK